MEKVLFIQQQVDRAIGRVAGRISYDELLKISKDLATQHGLLQQFLDPAKNDEATFRLALQLNTRLASMAFTISKMVSSMKLKVCPHPPPAYEGLRLRGADVEVGACKWKDDEGNEVCGGRCMGMPALVVKYPSGLAEDRRRKLVEMVRLVRGVHAECVVQCYGVCFEGEETWLVMEHMERPLAAALQSGLSKRKAVMIFREVAAALQWINEFHGLVHHNISPNSIWLDADDRPKLAGFKHATFGPSLASLDSVYVMQKAKTIQGVPLYMSPEMLSGSPPIPQFDVYAFGMMILYTFAGPTVVQAFKKPQEWIEAVCKGFRPKLDDVPLPPRMKAIIAASWAQDPQKRPRPSVLVKALGLSLLEDTIHFLPTDPRPALTSILDTGNMSSAAKYWYSTLCTEQVVLSVPVKRFVDTAPAFLQRVLGTIARRDGFPKEGDKSVVTAKWFDMMQRCHGMWWTSDKEAQKVEELYKQPWFSVVPDTSRLVGEEDGSYVAHYEDSSIVVMCVRGEWMTKTRILCFITPGGETYNQFDNDSTHQAPSVPALLKKHPLFIQGCRPKPPSIFD